VQEEPPIVKDPDPEPEPESERTQTMAKLPDNKTCLVPGCGQKRLCRGLCSKHYSRANALDPESLKYRMEPALAGPNRKKAAKVTTPIVPLADGGKATSPAAPGLLPTMVDERRARVAAAIEADSGELSIAAELLVRFAHLVGVPVEAYAPFVGESRLLVAGEAAIVLTAEGDVQPLQEFMRSREAGAA